MKKQINVKNKINLDQNNFVCEVDCCEFILYSVGL